MLTPYDVDKTILAGLVEHILSCLSYPEKGMPETLDWLQNVTRCGSIILCQIDLVDHGPIKKVVNHSYHPQWIQTYLTENFAKVDPVIRYAREYKGVYPWQDAYARVGQDCPGMFFEAAADFGLREGFACCIRGGRSRIVTACSLSVDKNTLTPAAEWALFSATSALHNAMRSAQRPLPPQRLSPREEEVLKWASDGKTVWEIGKILQLSEGTVKFHLSNIYRKLDVTNRAQAIAAAVQQDLL
ncbi:hypothetical protein CAI21_08635 [Alkalilimnicola ehrlichii]|uniref:HTH luxR-type domain-containing protein n=1 Tax=Alkalilimnicola ehrlichii TaxID=351052 RepID=A0A3E0WVQ1_9GAMM|nr:LuxR family transcriptional regulator [Alkalilimnicola ehrlichii]RFA29890.1 hypothetical protein CAI21_08635 [Alkalilimnicola ehrlichii]RFA36479.1 hypothetical protein CAL65_10905 [Alkalilimnicola ehrlichii]